MVRNYINSLLLKRYKMSLLKKRNLTVPAGTCQECKPGLDSTVFRLLIEPIRTDVRSAPQHDAIKQLANADRVQQLFVPSLSHVQAHVHGNGYHVHPEQFASVGHIGQMHAMMEPHALTARLAFSPGNDSTAVTAVLSSAHVQDLVQNGVVDVKVPLDQGTFRLHSTQNGRITAIEFAGA